MNIGFDQIKSYTDGKAGLIIGICEQVGLNEVFDRHLTQLTGRPPEISYGVLAQMMLVNMADDHHPLSRLSEYFENVDIETLFNMPIDRSKLNDDRFGGFLDLMQNAGCNKIMSEIAVKAFKRYGIKLSTINFDTTSKVMWGEYETADGNVGVVDITYGYSKDKRQDKKQIKLSMGTGQGICVDGKVLSGNKDDKTYNADNLDRANELIIQFDINKNDFFYIADSAVFTKEFLIKAKKLGIHVITRMSDYITQSKEAIRHAVNNLDELSEVEIEMTSKTSKYLLAESQCTYHDVPLIRGEGTADCVIISYLFYLFRCNFTSISFLCC